MVEDDQLLSGEELTSRAGLCNYSPGGRLVLPMVKSTDIRVTGSKMLDSQSNRVLDIFSKPNGWHATVCSVSEFGV